MRRAAVRRYLALPPLLLFWAAALYRLGEAGFWYDEFFNIDLTLGRPWSATLRTLLTEQPYPPLYATLLKLWEGLTAARPYAPGLEPGNGLEFVMRFPSAAAGLLLLATLVPLGKRLRLRYAVLLPWLLALHPTLLWYGRDLRLYTLWAWLVAAALWALMARRWRRYLLFGSAAMLTHYFSLFPLGAGALVAFLQERRKARRLFTTLALPFLIAAAWMGLAWRVTLGFHSFGTMGPPTPARFVEEAGPQLLTASAFLAPTGHAPSAALGFRLLAAAAAGLLWAALRSREGRLLAAAFFLGLGATFVTWQVRPVHNVRYLVWALVPAALGLLSGWTAVSEGLASLLSRRREAATWLGHLITLAALAALVLPAGGAALSLLRADPTVWRPDFRAMAAMLNREGEAGDRLIAEAAHGAQLFSAYRITMPVVRGEAIGGRVTAAQALRLIARSEGRIWTLLYQDEAVDPGGILLGTLEANGGYRTAMLYSGEARLFAYTLPRSAPLAPLTPTMATTATFGSIRLEGAAIHREGRLLAVYLFWRLETAQQAKLFGAVHLTTAIGQPPFAQRDKPILNDYWPLPRLPVGEQLPDRYEIVIPPDLPPGDYPLYALIYDPQSGVRLRTAQGEEVVPLGRLHWEGEPPSP